MASQLTSSPEVMVRDRPWSRDLPAQVPLLAVLTVVGLTLGGLLIGYQPVGDDPDLMYRPIKMELARALRSGTLPFWSDRFGLGVPLLAESHVAALYPPNWFFYRLLDVEIAYRWLMWLHYVALAGTTYLLARDYKISPWGAAISSVSFTLCGFMAAHACHEPFYCLMPYLPLTLWLARRYLATGQRKYQAGLALAIGIQLTLGHFQIQSWTIGLTLLLGAGELIRARASVKRFLGLTVGIAWGMAVAFAQLALTAELTRYTRFQRPEIELVKFGLPPAQLAQAGLPLLFIGDHYRPFLEENYWNARHTSVIESSWYVGILPFILVLISLTSPRRYQGMLVWKLLIPMSLCLACLPIAERDLYLFLIQVPILGTFRAAGRYTLLASLGLALLAGTGVERPLPTGRFRRGLIIAALVGLATLGWALYWSGSPDFASSLPAGWIPRSIALAASAWAISLTLVAVWWRGRVGPAVLFVATSLELALLFAQTPVRWDWAGRWRSGESPILKRLIAEPQVGLIAGFEANNLTVPLGISPATPYLGFLPPPPHFILDHLGLNKPRDHPEIARWGRRFGVTHGIYRAWTTPTAAAQSLAPVEDPVLDRLSFRDFSALKNATDPRWRLDRYPGAFPPVRVLLRARVVEDWPALFESLTKADHRDEVTYMRADSPRQGQSRRASRAHLLSWNGTEAVVEHDGTCDVVFRRGWYPGWFFRTNDGPEEPVYRADGGLQAVRLYGSGPSKIHFRYRSAWWLISSPISLGASVGAIVVLLQELRRKRPPRVVQQNS